MDRLARLRNELEEQKLGLTALRGRLDAERLRDQPDRAEQRRLRDLIGEHETTIAEINDNIGFELQRYNSQAARDARNARKERGREALTAHREVVGTAWRRVSEHLEAAIAAVHLAGESAKAVADDVRAAVLEGEPDTVAATTTFTNAARSIYGGSMHAHALGCLIAELMRALPAVLRDDIEQNFVALNSYGLAGRAPTSMAVAVATAEQQLAVHVGDVTLEEEPS